MPPAPLCKESGPPDESYTVNFCITASPAGAQVSVAIRPVEGSTDVVSDDPGVHSLTFFHEEEHLCFGL